jgi:hypothetical protein
LSRISTRLTQEINLRPVNRKGVDEVPQDNGRAEIHRQLQPESKEFPVVVLYAPRRVIIYPVFDHELDAIGSSQNSAHVGFFGVAFGGVMTLAITLLTVTIENANTRAAFWACLVACAILSAYFGLRAYFDWKKSQAQVRTIKKQHTNRQAHPGPLQVDEPNKNLEALSPVVEEQKNYQIPA